MNKLYYTIAVLLMLAFETAAQTGTGTSVFPISLKYFDAKKNNQRNQNELQWLAPCVTSEATFEIQYSTDGRSFATIYSFTADQLRCAQPFDYTDAQTRQGNSYYRIKMIAGANQAINSFVISVLGKNNGFELNAMLPSIVQTNTSLSISSAKNDVLQITVTNMLGKTVLQLQKPVVNGSNLIPFDFSMLAKGQYILSTINSEKAVRQIQFIKQ
jgi:hypothetical protein